MLVAEEDKTHSSPVPRHASGHKDVKERGKPKNEALTTTSRAAEGSLTQSFDPSWERGSEVNAAIGWMADLAACLLLEKEPHDTTIATKFLCCTDADNSLLDLLLELEGDCDA